ncbi:MAG: M20/M25/M40 family metallo-hydrolase [Bacteroidetes bacterium]|nr:M20/M25/M40 family metallo-hydrolase [Bacteroidota bacterium]
MNTFFRLLLFLTIIVSLFELQTSKAQNNDILTATQLVSSDSIESYIQHLENYGTRYMIAPNRLEIAEWLQNKFKTLGVDSTRIDTFETYTVKESLGLDTTTVQYNVVATIPGSTNKKIIICGHYDSFSYGDPYHIAPGADDDASGIAACLESARVLSEINYFSEHTIEIIAFAAEELMNYGLGGYDIHAANAEANNDTIDLVIHNDMIGYNDGNRTLYVSNYPNCGTETMMIASICDTYTNLSRHLWPSNEGPYADRAFYNRGYKCVYLEENFSANPNYHQPTDLLKNIDVDYCAEVTKISIGGTMKYDMQDETTSISDISLKDIYFNIHPNPIVTYATIDYELEKSGYIEIAIYDLTGKKLKVLDKGFKMAGLNNISFYNTDFKGLYFIALNLDNKNNVVKKVIFNK